MHSPHLKSGELHSILLKAEYLHKLFEILLPRRIVHSPHILIFSVIYGVTGIGFIGWIQSNFILLPRLFQLWPLGAL